MGLTLEDIFNKESIRHRAETLWNEKTIKSKCASKYKYAHIFKKYYPNDVNISWVNEFQELAKSQQTILVKGELIRTYDSLSNHDKTKIKHKFKLSVFAAKWFKLPSKDKRKLLNYVNS